MFVPYEPYNCFDVHRSNDRCVCGCSAVITSRSGDDCGYCSRCSEKRENYVNNLIGEIFIGKEGDLQFSTLAVLEKIRKSIIKERMFYQIDMFFGNDDKRPFIEPYEDASFTARLLSDKIEVTDMYLEALLLSPKLQEESKRKFLLSILSYDTSEKSHKIYQYYNEELSKMRNFDTDEIGALHAIVGGYKYERKFTPKNK